MSIKRLHLLLVQPLVSRRRHGRYVVLVAAKMNHTPPFGS